jgi:N utilization substance protein A
MNNDFIEAIEELEREKGIAKDLLIDAIESALVSAYKKNYGTSNNVRVEIDRETGDINVFMRRDIVEEVEDEFTQCSLEEAQEVDPEYEIGDVIEYQVTPQDFGRIAAQTAKQVVVQRIRETERGMIYEDYVGRTGEVVTGVVQRVSGDVVFINMGRAEGILSANEQIKGEHYRPQQRLKVYVMDVKKTTKGPQVFLSRTHPGLVKRLFELEVPEIQDGTVEIKSISREAGSRSKIAVCTYDENVDPVGACVGPRGQRVQAVVDELSGEKVDIVPWSDEPGKYISASLSPSKVEMVLINEAEKAATVVVPDYQLSLAIGKEGQNVRLAARLTSWKIDIKSHTQFEEMGGLDTVTQEDEIIKNPAQESETSMKYPAFSKMKKADLIAFAKEAGIDLDPKLKNADMIDIIKSAL